MSGRVCGRTRSGRLTVHESAIRKRSRRIRKRPQLCLSVSSSGIHAVSHLSFQLTICRPPQAAEKVRRSTHFFQQFASLGRRLRAPADIEMSYCQGVARQPAWTSWKGYQTERLVTPQTDRANASHSARVYLYTWSAFGCIG